MIAIVNDGMADRQPPHRVGDGGRLLLAGKLRRVNADDHQLAAVLSLQLPQLRDDVQTVDSAEGPEVEHHDLAAQLAQRQRAIGVDPVQAGR